MSHAAGARLKVVLDTNIYIGAFEFPGGQNSALWNAAEARRYQPLVSAAIVREMTRVLRNDFGWTGERLSWLTRGVFRVATLAEPRRAILEVPTDPDDNRVLECPAEGDADLIVSNDHHLLDLKV